MIVFRAQDIRFRLDRHAGQLWRGSERVHLPRKEWCVLRYLAENPGKLVSKEELHQIVWQDANVGPAAIDRAVSDVRRALGDRADDPLFIETVRGRGYRFVAEIESTREPTEPDPRHDISGLDTASGNPVASNHNGPRPQVGRFPKDRSGFSLVRAAQEIDLFRVVSFDHWPYESAVSYGSAKLSTPLRMDCSLVFGTKYRCHSERPEQFMSWGLVGHNFLDGENFEDANGNSLSSANVPPPPELWIQIEYVLFHSTKRSDGAKIDPLRRRLLAEGLASTRILGNDSPDRLAVGYLSDPWSRWYDYRDRTDKATRLLFASTITDLPYINAHSIPEAADYAYVQVSICDYRSYLQPLTYAEAFEMFDKYNAWFSHFGGLAVTPL